jgi:ABC-type Fe3+ transport system substrate-binding protein
MRWVWLTILLIAIMGVGSCGRSDATAELYIVSPHGANIRREFETAFSAWHKKKYGTEVRVHWPDMGGTNNIVHYLQNVYETYDTCGYDLMFGGGSATFDKLANARRKDGKPFPWIVPAKLPVDELTTIPREVRGTTLRGKNDAWIGATMSYFGLVVSKARVRELGLEAPRTWESVTDGKWIGQVSMADPSKSGSVMTAYEMVLQQYGWEKGWPVLEKMFANTLNIKDSGNAPAEEVGTENAAAGVVIDFFGRIQTAKEGSSLVEFVVPEGGSAIDADPIAILRGAPHAELANHFVEFVLSPKGQMLWVLKPGTPGGPVRSALGRMTILENLYDTRAADMTDPRNPFKGPAPLKVDRVAQAQRSVFLGELIKAALVDNHDALRAARVAVREAGDPPELLAEFDRLPMSAAEIKPMSEAFRADERVQTEARAKWRTDAAALFAEILTKAQSFAVKHK